ncbi:MAG: hypothetical protein LQ343_005886 [Gyalolechia ehrenbergii]|nr:MAG: hypothetical protein LQ343_005886 [Gyalolechia ehrenbergii]
MSPSIRPYTPPPPNDFAQNRPSFRSASSERQQEPRVRLPPPAHPSIPEEGFPQTLPILSHSSFPPELWLQHPPTFPPAQHPYPLDPSVPPTIIPPQHLLPPQPPIPAPSPVTTHDPSLRNSSPMSPFPSHHLLLPRPFHASPALSTNALFCPPGCPVCFPSNEGSRRRTMSAPTTFGVAGGNGSSNREAEEATRVRIGRARADERVRTWLEDVPGGRRGRARSWLMEFGYGG